MIRKHPYGEESDADSVCVTEDKPKETKTSPIVESDVDCVIDDQQSKTVNQVFTEGDAPLLETAFICGSCAKSFATQDECVTHMASHIETLTHQCDQCVKFFHTKSGLESHKETVHDQQRHMKAQPEPLTYNCDKCEGVFLSNLDLEWHDETNHEQIKGHHIRCSKCEFETLDPNTMSVHIQANHMLMKVNIATVDQTIISCNQCEYKCKYNIQLKNHTKTSHEVKHKYECKECSYSTNYIADVWEHMFRKHSGQSNAFDQKQFENMALKIVVEQNVEIIEEMETLKKDTKGAFQHMADIYEENIERMREETNEKCKTLADTLLKLYTKISNLEASYKRKKVRTKPTSIPTKLLKTSSKPAHPETTTPNQK